METNYCNKKCCRIITRDFDPSTVSHFTYDKNNKKVGVFVYNSARGSILLVQSRGKLWGFPKGTLERDECVKDCAIRELKEEAGIILTQDELKKYIIIQNKALYYIYDTENELGTIQGINTNEYNDATGFCWVKINCLDNLINTSIIKLNYHTRYIINNYLNFTI